MNIAKVGWGLGADFDADCGLTCCFSVGVFSSQHGESGFSSDKGRFGRIIKQKRFDHQETALFSNNVSPQPLRYKN